MNRPFQLPASLPAQTALTLFELFSQLADVIWDQYERDLLELRIAELNPPPVDPQMSFDFDDEPPF
jgi:hypothetical protein